MKRLTRVDLAICLALLLAAVAFYGDALLGGRVLLPADNLFQFAPWASAANAAGVSAPHNQLISDQILQNYSWRVFARQEVLAGHPPLWNPYIFGGMPYLAAGQYGVLYPLGLIFYLMPPEYAYVWFAILHLALAAIGGYLLLRVLGASRAAGAVTGLTYAFSGFLVVSMIWPQVIGSAVWLPWLVLLTELILRRTEGARVPLSLVAAGLAGLVGTQFLAGHFEISFYVLFVVACYAAWRLVGQLLRRLPTRDILISVLWLGIALFLGVGLAGAQLLPFFELAPGNFRGGLVSFADVVGYALPVRHVLEFFLPNIFGNPAEHQYLDPLLGATRAIVGPGGEQTSIFFGVKNYVEGAGYVGVVALIAVTLAVGRLDRSAKLFGSLAVWSLLLAFGTPLYRVFFVLPFFDQLHTPFRWLLPASFALAVLAGLGADRLGRASGRELAYQRGVAALAGIAALASAGLIVLTAVARAHPGFAERLPRGVGLLLVGRDDRLKALFWDPTTLVGYEARNVAFLVLGLVAGAALIYFANRAGASPQSRADRGKQVARVALAVLVFIELYVIGSGFQTRSDPALLQYVSPVVRFLQDRRAAEGPFRVVGFGDADVLPPNTGMRFGIEDARGYDSMFSRQYVEYWSSIEPTDALKYNQIANLRRPESLSSPLLDLLNVRYVLTTSPTAAPGLRLAFDGGDGVLVYERPTTLPRAFIVPEARASASSAGSLAAIRAPGFDPASAVIVESSEALPLAGGRGSARIAEYSATQVIVESTADAPAYLVLADTFAPGWDASIDGQSAPTLRADYNFRLVAVPAGRHTVVFHYSPMSFKLGLVMSMLAAASLLMLVGYSVWRRLTLKDAEPGSAHRIGRNSLAPLTTSLLNKVVDVAFAMLMLRVLGPANAGKYTVAIVVFGYLDTLTNFGLNALLIREVARAPDARHKYLTGSLILRLALWASSVPLLLLLLNAFRAPLALESDTLVAISLLLVSLIPGNVASALSSEFNAFERMEYPATMAVVANICRIGLGTLVLLAGWGIIGLATVSLVVNILNAVLLTIMTGRALGWPRFELEAGLLRKMLVESFPLMLNNLLATIFFRVDSLMLQAFQGSVVVGYYATAYKLPDGLQIIPQSFVFAIFPMLSRRAEAGAEAVRRAYVGAIRMLVMLAMPVAVVTAALATQLILVIGGANYLPQSAIALAILIWYLPLSFVNGVTQYVLIAINQQRFITLSFCLVTTFNIVANLYAIPRYSYAGAAAVTILSEIVLMAPFYYCVRKNLGRIPLASLLGRPAIAALGMSAIVWLSRDISLLGGLVVGAAAYPALLLLVGAVTPSELARVAHAGRERLARRLATPTA